MKFYQAMIAACLCLGFVSKADAQIQFPEHKDRDARLPDHHKNIATTPFYDVHKGDTWTISGWVSPNVNKKAFQSSFATSHKVSGNSVKSFTWDHNKFSVVVNYNHDGRIYLMSFIIGNGRATINAAEKK